MNNYDDIINLPHYRSPNREKMPMENRAAQFAPFAALSGHNEAVAETSRLTEDRLELTEEEKRHISDTLIQAYEEGKALKITFFKPDQRKKGGEYLSVKDHIRKINELDKIIYLNSGLSIPMDFITALSCL